MRLQTQSGRDNMGRYRKCWPLFQFALSGFLLIGMVFPASATEILYATGGSPTLGSALFNLDPPTGAATVVGSAPFDFHEGALALPSPVPEPSTLLLCCLGLAGLVGAVWRRNRK